MAEDFGCQSMVEPLLRGLVKRPDEDFAVEEVIELGDDLRFITPNGIELVRVIGLISKEGAGQVCSPRPGLSEPTPWASCWTPPEW